MNATLGTRTKEHVRTFWEKTQDQEIQAMFPASIASLEEALTLFETSKRDDATSFGRIILDQNTYIGDIWCYGIDEKNEKMAMLSIVIFDKAYWGKGIASAMIPQFLDEIFERYHLETIGAFTYATNTRSIQALKKSGFHPVESFEENGVESVYLEFNRIQSKKE